MRKIAMILSVIFLAACAGAPVLQEGLQKIGDIAIEDAVFYEKMECGQAENLDSCKFVGIRSDEFSKEVSATFRGAFAQKLRESGTLNIIRVPVRIGIQIVYDERPSQVAEVRLLQAKVSVFRGELLIFEKQQRLSSVIFFKAIVIGGPEILAKRFADALGNYFANEVASVLREKGEIRSEKK